MHLKRAEELGDFEKVSRVKLGSVSGEDGWLSLARRSQARGLGKVSHVMRVGADEKARIERMRSSPDVGEPLNSKIIKKGFVPELRSRKCFSCFEIPTFYVIYIYILTFHVRFTYPYLAMKYIWCQS